MIGLLLSLLFIVQPGSLAFAFNNPIINCIGGNYLKLSDSIRYETKTVLMSDEVMRCIDTIRMLSNKSNKIITLYFDVNNLSKSQETIDVSLGGNKYPKKILHLSNINLMNAENKDEYKTTLNRFSIELNSFINQKQNVDYFSYKRLRLIFRILSASKKTTDKVEIKSVIINCT